MSFRFKIVSRRRSTNVWNPPVLFVFGFFSWILYLIFAFVGELVSHIVFSQHYASLGDNPSQIGGLILAVLISFFADPIAWSFYRKRSLAAQHTVSRSS